MDSTPAIVNPGEPSAPSGLKGGGVDARDDRRFVLQPV